MHMATTFTWFIVLVGQQHSIIKVPTHLVNDFKQTYGNTILYSGASLGECLDQMGSAGH